MSETPDEHADRLARVASELAQRVRDDDPEANARWLAATLPDRADRWRLLFVLAAAVPDDRPWSHLTAWTVLPRDQWPAHVETLQPCGTRAAYRRHVAHGEEPCEPCTTANRAYDRARKRSVS